MRSFAYKNPDYVKNEVVPELIEEHPCYQQSVYDAVMYDETPDGDLIQCDMNPNPVESGKISPSAW